MTERLTDAAAAMFYTGYDFALNTVPVILDELRANQVTRRWLIGAAGAVAIGAALLASKQGQPNTAETPPAA
jgi:hypothetical protein